MRRTEYACLRSRQALDGSARLLRLLLRVEVAINAALKGLHQLRSGHRPLPGLVVEQSGMRRPREIVRGLRTQPLDRRIKPCHNIALRYILPDGPPLAFYFVQGGVHEHLSALGNHELLASGRPVNGTVVRS